jgi:hypothetical protein
LIVVDKWGTKSFSNCDSCKVNINVIDDASVNFECSLNKEIWKPCEEFRTKVNGTIYLKDTSIPSQGSAINYRAWEVKYVDGQPEENLDYSLDISGKSSPFFQVKKLGRIKIKLIVGDGIGRHAEGEQTLLSTPAMAPQWEAKIKDAEIF